MKTILAALYLVIMSPLFLLNYLLQHKLLLFIVLAGVIMIVARAAILGGGPDSPKVETPAYQLTAPPVEAAPVVLRTQSRVYYVKDFTDDNRTVTLFEYYLYESDAWDFYKKPLVIDREVYGPVRFYPR